MCRAEQCHVSSLVAFAQLSAVVHVDDDDMDIGQYRVRISGPVLNGAVQYSGMSCHRGLSRAISTWKGKNCAIMVDLGEMAPLVVIAVGDFNIDYPVRLGGSYICSNCLYVVPMFVAGVKFVSIELSDCGECGCN